MLNSSKITGFLLIVILPFATIQAQNLAQFSIAPSGGFSTNANGSISFTIGQTMPISTFYSGATILSQGFQQGESATSLAGRIYSPIGLDIPNVRLSIKSDSTKIINVNGAYAQSIPNGNYILRPSKNNDIKKANGVSTIDISLIQAHILKKTLLNSPYKLIAADVSGDKKISSIDITYIKRLILALDTSFVGNRLWAFVDSAYQFPDVANPFPFKDSINYSTSSQTTSTQNFVGIKLGDVNYDWKPSILGQQAADNTPIELYYDTVQVLQQGIIEVPIRCNNFNAITGLQFTLGFDPALFEFEKIANNNLGIEYGTTYSKNGNISFLWNDANNLSKSLQNGSKLFTIFLRAKDRGNHLSTLTLNNAVTTIEAYDSKWEFHPIVLTKGAIVQETNFPITVVAQEGVSLAPNPSNGNFKLEIASKHDATIKVQIMNVKGENVLAQTYPIIKGKQSLLIHSSIPAGSYYLVIEGMENRYVRQLLIVK